jgi:hypothetical protein
VALKMSKLLVVGIVAIMLMGLSNIRQSDLVFASSGDNQTTDTAPTISQQVKAINWHFVQNHTILHETVFGRKN